MKSDKFGTFFLILAALLFFLSGKAFIDGLWAVGFCALYASLLNCILSGVLFKSNFDLIGNIK